MEKPDFRINAAFIILTLLVFLAMNILTPKMADDFIWEYISGTSQKVQSPADIMLSVYHYYTGEYESGFRGGRIVPVILTQLFVSLDKLFFNVANSIAYIVLILLMCFHITGERKINILLYGAVNIFLWYFVPSWGENFLWLTGSCFYVWPTIIILLFLVPLRKRSINKKYRINILFSILYCILGLIAGLTYENAAAAVFFLLLVYAAAKVMHKETFAPFEILGMIGFLAGFVILLAAPGNYARLNSYELIKEYGFFTRLLIRFLYTTNIFIKYGLLLTGLSVIAGFELLIHQKRRINIFSFLYLVAGIISAYSMVLSPVFIERVFYPVTIFLVIALLNALCQIDPPEMLKRNRKMLLLLILALFSFSLLKAGVVIVKIYKGDETYNVLEKHYGQVH
ncbi:MAG: DUF6056 family protein [Treponema sp.]|jgi:hypothetical protein|nr:DUF6056 family protein [Treponema sp.]